MSSRNTIVAQHPILGNKAVECRFALDPGHWFAPVDLGLVISNGKMDVSGANLVNENVPIKAISNINVVLLTAHPSIL